MYKHVACGVGLIAAGGLGYWLYKKRQSQPDLSDSDTATGIELNGTTYPILPIHPKSEHANEGIFKPVTVAAHGRYKPGAMIPARSQDYENPAQLYATTGPSKVAPIPGHIYRVEGGDGDESLMKDWPLATLISGPIAAIPGSGRKYRGNALKLIEMDSPAAMVPLQPSATMPNVVTNLGWASPLGAPFFEPKQEVESL
jgi:hypothetical protein